MDSGHSGTIPVDSGAILAELPDSGWNLWGTVKYCPLGLSMGEVALCMEIL